MAIASRRPGHVVENSIVIAAPAEKVFDYVTDVRRERGLTPGPIGAGTRYRVRFGRGAGVAIIENTGFDRPRSWSAGSTSRRLDVRFQGQVTEVAGGCRLAVRNELFPHGVLRALSPFLRLLIRRSWEQDLRAIKTIIERLPSSPRRL